MALRHGSRRPVVGAEREHQLGRRAVVHAGVRRPGVHVHRDRQSGTVSGDEPVSVGIEQARPEPVHGLDRQAQCDHRRSPVVLPADAARPLRPRSAGPADPGERRGHAGGDRGGQGGLRARPGRRHREAAVEALRRDPRWPRRRRHVRDETRILQAEASRDGLSGPARRRDSADGDERVDGVRARGQSPRHLRHPERTAGIGTVDGRARRVRHRDRRGQMGSHVLPCGGVRGCDRGQRPRVRDDVQREGCTRSTRGTASVVWEIAAAGRHQHRRRGRRRHPDRARRPGARKHSRPPKSPHTAFPTGA